MKKKRIIIVCVIIVLFVGLRIYLINKEKLKMPINAGYEHQQKVNDFVAKEKSEDPQIEIKTNESGYTNVLIGNKQSLTKVMGLDQMFIVDDKITQSVTYLNKLLEDTDLKLKGPEDYYYGNTDIIVTILGVGDVGAFTSLVNKLNFAGDESIYKAIIDENSVSKLNNDIKFNLTLQTLTEEQEVFNMTFTLNESNQEDSKIYWN